MWTEVEVWMNGLALLWRLGLGLGLGTLLVLSMAIPHHILWCRREDRRFDLLVRLKHNERDAKLRAAGVSEEDILELRKKIEAAQSELGR